MTAPATIEATTDQGTGLILPVSKALTHLMAIHTAIVREWPMDVAGVNAEFEAASGHLRDAVIPEELMTEEAHAAVRGWIQELDNQVANLRSSTNTEAPITDLDIDNLKRTVSNTWQLLTTLDRELTGLEPTNADPGRLP